MITETKFKEREIVKLGELNNGDVFMIGENYGPFMKIKIQGKDEEECRKYTSAQLKSGYIIAFDDDDMEVHKVNGKFVEE